MSEKKQLQTAEELADHLTTLGPLEPLAFGERVQRAALLREASRVVQRVDALGRGELDWLSLEEAWEVMELARASAIVSEISCLLECDRLRMLGPDEADMAIDGLRRWAEVAPPDLRGTLLLAFESDMDITRDAGALGLATAARLRGWQVATGVGGEGDILRLGLRSVDGDYATLLATESADGVSCRVRLREAPGEDDVSQTGRSRSVQSVRELDLPDEPPTPEAPRFDRHDEQELSVTDLFGSRIMLRDMEPRSPDLQGIEDFRAELGWDETYLPRKNEPEYAQALLRIIGGDRAEESRRILYVGDTLLNDGGAIRGLQRFGPQEMVWGFLCGATKARLDRDVILDRIYLGAAWASVWTFLDRACAAGLTLDADTWVLFDLDQTVYAAKGREDESLMRARWDAVRDYLESIVPAYKFDPARAEALYREFDRDEYHPVTRDNLDYTVLLVLATASGLADATEIRDYANSERPTIGSLADELRNRAAMRLGHEDIGAVLNAIKAVSFNTANGDPTPCKDFRRHECLAMAARMRGDIEEGREGRILLNREVVDLISYLRRTPVQLLAVSDRPIEAGVADGLDGEGPTTDLMTVPMRLGDHLRSLG